jgi:hypothetical protein
MSKEPELAVGESLVTRDDDVMTVETTRVEETLFTRTYADPETGALRLALQVDVTTGRTAIDPRHVDRSFWTLVAGGEERPMSELEAALGEIPDPSIEVKPEARAIRIYTETAE